MFPDVATPALLVDVDVLAANARRMSDRASMLGVALRPHAKTVKSPELLSGVVRRGAIGLTVSTLGEIRTLRDITRDILYAVPVAHGKADPILNALGDAPIRLTVVLDDEANLSGVPDDQRVDVSIEVDSDGERGGIAPDAPGLVDLAERIASRHRLRGVMTHAGGSYLVDRGHVPQVAARERDAVVTAALRLTGAGHRIDMVSVGSTPTMAVVDDLGGVTEMRPGVYLFGDLSMVALGACGVDDLAVSTLATVIGRAHAGDVSIIDAGWSSLSQDGGVKALDGRTGLGVVVVEGGRLDSSDLVVTGASQEHGLVTKVGGGATGLSTGSRVRVYPNHACATAEMHSEMTLVSSGTTVGRVARPRAW